MLDMTNYGLIKAYRRQDKSKRWIAKELGDIQGQSYRLKDKDVVFNQKDKELVLGNLQDLKEYDRISKR